MEPPAGPRSSFATTRWSVVLAAAHGDPPAARAALATLCERYWYPLYAYVRRRGHPPADAEDLVQGFFARLLEKRDLGGADPARGSFRAYLLGAVRHHVANVAAAEGAWKRGGRAAVLSLDLAAAEGRYGLEPADGRTPERLFEAEWARTLLDRVLGRLAAEHAARGKQELFARLQGELAGGEEGAGDRAALARELGLSPGALKVAIHRLRRRYRELLRREVAETLADPAGAEDELRALLAALGE